MDRGRRGAALAGWVVVVGLRDLDELVGKTARCTSKEETMSCACYEVCVSEASSGHCAG